MKSCFVAIVAALSFVSFAVAGDSGEIKSVVVNHGQSTPAPAPVVVATPAPVAACTDCVAAPVVAAPVCANGRCQTQRLYSVEQESSESCRNRLFGGHVVRKTNRTVYKPVRR